METLGLQSQTFGLQSFAFELPIRRADLDANGHVNNGTYQSYFEEAREAAFAEAGLFPARAKNLPSAFGSVFLEYKAELKHPDSVRILTFFPEDPKENWEIRQEMYRSSDGVFAAFAKFSVFSPGEEPEPPELKKEGRFFEHSVPLRWTDISPENHPYLSSLQYYLDDARIKSFIKAGFDLKELNRKGVGPVIYKATLDYFDSVIFPETVSVRTRVEKGEKNRLLFVQDLFRTEGEVEIHVCRGKFYGIFMDLHSKRPFRFSEEEKKRFMTDES